MIRKTSVFRVILLFCMLLMLALATACNIGGNEKVTASDSVSEIAEMTETDNADDIEETTDADYEFSTLGELTGDTYTAELKTAETAPLPDMPIFSQMGGYCNSGTKISLSKPEGFDNCDIRYTTDGNVPTKSSPKYSSPIKLSKTSVIRAAMFNGGKLTGFVATNTYIVKENKGVAYTVSITANTKELDKIVNNPTASIEIPAHIEILSHDGSNVISQDAGVKIFGGSSRSLPQKSFKLIARPTEKLGKDYYCGTGNFNYPFFEQRVVRSGKNQGKVLKKYDSLILRNGGNDSIQHSSVDPDSASLLRDNIANNLAAKVTESLDYACSEFAEVYVNGEYYGILDMKENMNENYVRRVYGVDANNVAIVKSELDTTRGGRFDGTWFFYESDNEAERKAWISLCNKAIDNINANSKQYNKVYEELISKIDIDSFIEYIAYGIYTCNTDWPHNNVKLWRYTGEQISGIPITDGKWRFMTRDMDMSFGRYNSPNINPELDNTADVDTFYRILGNYCDYSYYFKNSGNSRLYKDSLGFQGLFAFFLKNNEFREKFKNYCSKLGSDETVSMYVEIYNKQYNTVSALISDHLNRWKGTYPTTYVKKTWVKSAAAVKRFASERKNYFSKYLDRAMKLSK